jgi:multiple antibiotic resistance protein
MVQPSLLLAEGWAVLGLQDVNGFFQAVVSIFAIVNPIGNLPIFVGLTEEAPLPEQRRVFRLATIVAFGIVVVMAIGGKYLLRDVFHISLDEFRLAGGVLLIVMGVLRVIELQPRHANHDDAGAGQLQAAYTRLAISPIASPLLVGPGSIVVVMLIADRSGVLFALAAAAVCFAMVLLILNWAHLAFRLMGKIGSLAVGRVMNIFIAAIGVHFVAESVRNIFLAKSG